MRLSGSRLFLLLGQHLVQILLIGDALAMLGLVVVLLLNETTSAVAAILRLRRVDVYVDFGMTEWTATARPDDSCVADNDGRLFDQVDGEVFVYDLGVDFAETHAAIIVGRKELTSMRHRLFRVCRVGKWLCAGRGELGRSLRLVQLLQVRFDEAPQVVRRLASERIQYVSLPFQQ